LNVVLKRKPTNKNPGRVQAFPLEVQCARISPLEWNLDCSVNCDGEDRILVDGKILDRKREHMPRMFLRITVSVFLGLTLLAFQLQAESDAGKLFKANCALCHGANGDANTPTGKALKAKDLKAPEIQSKSDAELLEAISKGRGKMPAFGSKFSPDVITSLVAYIRQLQKQ
jgi:cytochrome c553